LAVYCEIFQGLFMKKIFVISTIAVLGSGCASIARGTTEDVVVNSVPAGALVTTSIGHTCPKSPCTFHVARKTPFTALASKPGYSDGSLFIDTVMSGKGTAGLAGNFLVGGVIGVGVDAVSGATLDHIPNPAIISLQPLGAEKSGPLVSNRAKSKTARKRGT
jgi:hypothetical protein